MPFYSIDGLYETLGGVMLTITNGVVLRVNADATFDAFTGDTVTPDATYYWAEDGQHVYLAHGGKLARLDVENLTVTLLNENTPNAVTHVCRSKGYLICNGNDVIISSSPWNLSQVFAGAGFLYAAATLTDQAGWILVGGSSPSPGLIGLIYLSEDNGMTWRKVFTGSGSDEIQALCYMGAGVVLAGDGAGHVLRSEDYGETWADVGALGATTGVLVIEKVTDNVAIAGGTGGVGYRSTDNGETWSAIATPADFGLEIGSALVWSASLITLGVTASGGAAHIWRSTNGGTLFTDVETLDAAATVTSMVKVSLGVGLAAVHVAVGPPAIGKIYRTTDSGANWTDIGEIGLAAGEIPWAFLFTSTGELIFASLGIDLNSRIWKSVDQGLTWVVVTELEVTPEEAISVVNSLEETHTAGQVLIVGRTYNDSISVQNVAAKWQTGVGRGTAPQGDVFYSEDITRNYEAVDSWGRFNAEQVPDAVNGVFTHRSLVFTPGQRSTEINYNQADPNEPWAFSDPALPFGLLAPHSWVSWDQLNLIMYLTDTDNVIQVVQFRGREQQQMSQEWAEVINDRTLVTNPSAAKAWPVAIRGLPHYVLTFPDDNLTLCYNVMTQHWWRWAYWNGTAYEAAIINSYVYWKAQNKHLIGDRRDNGKIYTIGGLTDNDQPIRFELTSGHIAAGGFLPKQAGRMIYKVKRGQATDASAPVFSWSARDNGNPQFGLARSVSLGLTNETEFFGYLNRCGQYNTRQHRIVHVDTKSDFIISEVDES